LTTASTIRINHLSIHAYQLRVGNSILKSAELHFHS